MTDWRPHRPLGLKWQVRSLSQCSQLFPRGCAVALRAQGYERWACSRNGARRATGPEGLPTYPGVSYLVTETGVNETSFSETIAPLKLGPTANERLFSGISLNWVVIPKVIERDLTMSDLLNLV